MRKAITITLCAALVFCGCESRTGAGAYAGGEIGSILGSAIGGIIGGYDGSNIGTLVGLAGGAVAGAAIGSAADNAAKQGYDQRQADRRERQTRKASAERQRQYERPDTPPARDDSGYDPQGRGDDRIEFDGDGGNPKAPEVALDKLAPGLAPGPATDFAGAGPIEIRNIRFTDATGDGALSRGEQAKVSFEIMNRSGHAIDNVRPVVADTMRSRGLMISPSVMVERIAPDCGVRYTATLMATKSLRAGRAVVKLAVEHEGREAGRATKYVEVPLLKN